MNSFNTCLGIFAICLLIHFTVGDDGVDPTESRFLIPRITTTTCNYTAEPGLSCASCNQVLLCNRNNVGILRTCGFLAKYCNNGHCSFFPGPACNPTTTESDSTTNAQTTTEGTTTSNSDTTTTNGG